MLMNIESYIIDEGRLCRHRGLQKKMSKKHAKLLNNNMNTYEYHGILVGCSWAVVGSQILNQILIS